MNEHPQAFCADSTSEKQALQPHGEPSRSTSRLSLRTAIDAKCRGCIYDPIGGTGTWREQVAACTSRTCPLFQARPLPRKGGAE